ncbi:MAG: hypothetical protein ABL885_00435 [Methylophilaceae bacterium]
MKQPINSEDIQQIGNFSLKELAALLVKHFNLHEGLYETSISLQVAVGAVGPTPDSVVPGAMLGITSVGLRKAEVVGLHTVDASVINPQKKTKRSLA